MNSEIFWRSDWYQMYRLHSDVYFSNLMDADRLYNNFVGQEMNFFYVFIHWRCPLRQP